MNPLFKLEWMEKYWSPVDAAAAKKWMLELVCRSSGAAVYTLLSNAPYR